MWFSMKMSFSYFNEKIPAPQPGKLLEGGSLSPHNDVSFHNSDIEKLDISDIEHLDGNISIDLNNKRVNRAEAALGLPVITTNNLRSMMPKIKSLKADIIERNVDISFLQEIWEQSDSDNFKMKLKQCLSLMVSNTYLNQDQKMQRELLIVVLP